MCVSTRAWVEKEKKVLQVRAGHTRKQKSRDHKGSTETHALMRTRTACSFSFPRGVLGALTCAGDIGMNIDRKCFGVHVMTSVVLHVFERARVMCIG
jgi:hypothetical protein